MNINKSIGLFDENSHPLSMQVPELIPNLGNNSEFHQPPSTSSSSYSALDFYARQNYFQNPIKEQSSLKLIQPPQDGKTPQRDFDKGFSFEILNGFSDRDITNFNEQKYKPSTCSTKTIQKQIPINERLPSIQKCVNYEKPAEHSHIKSRSEMNIEDKSILHGKPAAQDRYVHPKHQSMCEQTRQELELNSQQQNFQSFQDNNIFDQQVTNQTGRSYNHIQLSSKESIPIPKKIQGISRPLKQIEIKHKDIVQKPKNTHYKNKKANDNKTKQTFIKRGKSDRIIIEGCNGTHPVKQHNTRIHTSFDKFGQYSNEQPQNNIKDQSIEFNSGSVQADQDHRDLNVSPIRQISPILSPLNVETIQDYITPLSPRGEISIFQNNSIVKHSQYLSPLSFKNNETDDFLRFSIEKRESSPKPISLSKQTRIDEQVIQQIEQLNIQINPLPIEQSSAQSMLEKEIKKDDELLSELNLLKILYQNHELELLKYKQENEQLHIQKASLQSEKESSLVEIQILREKIKQLRQIVMKWTNNNQLFSGIKLVNSIFETKDDTQKLQEPNEIQKKYPETQEKPKQFSFVTDKHQGDQLNNQQETLNSITIDGKSSTLVSSNQIISSPQQIIIESMPKEITKKKRINYDEQQKYFELKQEKKLTEENSILREKNRLLNEKLLYMSQLSHLNLSQSRNSQRSYLPLRGQNYEIKKLPNLKQPESLQLSKNLFNSPRRKHRRNYTQSFELYKAIELSKRASNASEQNPA